MTRLVQIVVSLAGVAILVAGLNWSSVYELRIRSDLRQIAKQVRKADVGLEQKEKLLDVIDSIRGRVQQGKRPNVLSWWEITDAINELVDCGIRDDEPRLIERELNRIMREMDETAR